MFFTRTILNDLIDLFWCLMSLSATSWQPVLVVEEAGVPGENPTMGKQLVNFITLTASRVSFVIYKAGREPTPYW